MTKKKSKSLCCLTKIFKNLLLSLLTPSLYSHVEIIKKKKTRKVGEEDRRDSNEENSFGSDMTHKFFLYFFLLCFFVLFCFLFFLEKAF